jgi:hypothetical protein
MRRLLAICFLASLAADVSAQGPATERRGPRIKVPARDVKDPWLQGVWRLVERVEAYRTNCLTGCEPAVTDFIRHSKQALSPYEVIRLRLGGRSTRPDRIYNSRHTLGQRVWVKARWVDQPLEEFPGLVWSADFDASDEPVTTVRVLGKHGDDFLLSTAAPKGLAPWDAREVTVEPVAPAIMDGKAEEVFGPFLPLPGN